MALLIMLSSQGSLIGQDLPRRAFMGILLGPVDDAQKIQWKLGESEGIHVRRIFDQSSAKAAGILADDIILSLGKESISSVPQFLRVLKPYQTGEKLKVVLLREGKKLNKKLILTPMPPEEYEGGKVHLGTIEVDHGRLRSILTLPDGESKNRPLVYFVQGIDCGGVDEPFNPDGAFRQLIRHMHKQGFATYRVEKSGVGDSKGKACVDCDFLEDAKGFLAGLQDLKKDERIDAERIYIVGLSMGGVWAPWMAAQESVKGVAVYGTIGRPWTEYMLENSRRQAMLGGTNFGELETSLKNDMQLYYQMYVEGNSPEEVRKSFPHLSARIDQISADPTGEPVRHIHANRIWQFQQQLQQLNFSELWSKTDAQVLAIWGKGDYVSNQEDHQFIADIVNATHPGAARYQEVNANHWFETYASEREAFDGRAADKEAPINQEVFVMISDWIDSVEKGLAKK